MAKKADKKLVKKGVNTGIGLMFATAGGKIGYEIAKMSPHCGLITRIGGYLIGSSIGDMAADRFKGWSNDAIDFDYKVTEPKEANEETTEEEKEES